MTSLRTRVEYRFLVTVQTGCDMHSFALRQGESPHLNLPPQGEEAEPDVVAVLCVRYRDHRIAALWHTRDRNP